MGCGALACHPRQSVAMSKRDHTLRLSEADGVGVVAVFAEMVVSPAIVAVPTCWAIPDCVFGL